MNELKMSLNQIKNETKKAFEDGYDHPQDMSGCTNSANQEFVCCTDDCSDCNGNNECLSCNCDEHPDNTGNICTMNCPDENLKSCIIEQRWEMSEQTPPKTMTDEHGSTVHYIKIIRITRNYQTNENPLS